VSGPATGPVVLVTGATDGIGRETAIELARRGARVIVHGRSAAKAEATRAAVEQTRAGAGLEPVVADLASLAEARGIAATLDARGASIDVLLNNAGVFMKSRESSRDGHEVTFAVNHLAPFALTHALLAAKSGASLRRVVNVSSIAHSRGRVDLDDLGFERRGFDAYATYAASKLANVLFTVELARRLAARGVTVNALHPGVVSTKLLTQGFGMRGSDSLAEGAATSVRLALDEDVASVTGGYFAAEKPANVAPAGRDLALARRFYEKSAELAGVAPLPEPTS
jgi:NAD(P)-dependent dehydrogenase (short-subunit alcohol dehydrogenase family)